MKVPSLIRNTLLTRVAWLRKLLDPRRDIDQECGHPESVSIDDYKKLFLRGDVAARVVELLPEETWSTDPEVFETEDKSETEFEARFKELNDRIPLFTYLQRIDILSGIGRFGVLLLGMDDGLPLATAVEGVSPQGDMSETPSERKLLYVRSFDESLVQVASLETNLTNPRYGLPKSYNLTFADAVTGWETPTLNLTSQVVDWTRIIHVADNRMDSEVYGLPRMQKVVNRLLDLRKIAGGSGEMFWKGGFPGISMETHPTLDEDFDFDADATKEQVEAYMNGLQRYIGTVGMTAKSLMPNVADPTPHLELQLKLIAVAMGVPMRIFTGSERGELASSQDAIAWNQRINRRREKYVDPFILRPLLDRLIGIGALPRPAEPYQIEWKDLNSPSEEVQATVAEKRTNALGKYVQSGSDILMPPFHYLTLILGMEEDEANAVIKAAEKALAAENFLRELVPEPVTLPPGSPLVARTEGNRPPAAS